MIQPILYLPFYLSKVNHHPIAVQLAATAEDGDNPIVTVQLGALAVVVEHQAVAGRHLNSFLNVVHSFVLDNEIAAQAFGQSIAKLLGFLMFL